MDNVQSRQPSNLIPMIMLGMLFFIFGLVSWVNSILIPYFKVSCELTHTQSYLVALAFYIAYLVMSIPAARLIGWVGSRRGIMIGLWLMSAGTLMFVPAAYTRAYSIFLTGLFTIGTGLSILQTVANPYVTILGPIESAARRISIMGLCNKIAGILAPLLFAAVILKSTDNELFEVLKNNSVTGVEKDILLDGLIRRVIVPYSVLALFLFLFGCAIYFIRLPELGNNQQEDIAHASKDRKSIGSYPYLIMGVFAIFFHVAAQVISIDTIISYAESMGFNLQEAKIQMSGHTTSLSIWCLSLMGVCNALIYAGIWPLAIHDLGRWTNLGSSFMVMALCGNAFMPVIYGLIADHHGLRSGYIVLIPCFLYLIFYAFYGYKINHWSELWKLKKDK